MRTICEQVKGRYFSTEMSASLLQNFPADLGAQFGLVFWSRALGVEFGERFRKDPLRYKPVGLTVEVTLRSGPPRMPEMKSKGYLSSPMYKALDVWERRGVLRPTYLRFGDPRAELPIPLESGLLKHVQGEWVVKGLEVDAEVFEDTGMADRLAAAAGARPVPMRGVSSSRGVW